MDARGLDRLLPRHHVAPMKALIDWDVRRRRVVWKRGETSVEGSVVDLSLDGALIEVPAGSALEVGDVVAVRLGGIEGEAFIRHKRPSGETDETDEADDRGDADPTTEPESWLYGVQWVKNPDLDKAVSSGVAQLRANASHVRHTWEAQRR